MPAGDEYLARRLRPFTTTIFATMSELAVATGAVNLGQGFPDTDGPDELREAAVAAIREGRNQYPPGNGIPELRQAVAAHQRDWYGLDLDPDAEVLVTVGATEAIAASLLALCEPGDEVVMFEPTYDSYAACAAMAGAVPRLVRLHPPDWSFDPDELAAAASSPRARLVLLNTPHNPTGKVFTSDELGQVAALCRDHDLLAVTDEVYEHLVFDGSHVPLATLPGMRERTVTISSGGKTFSFTGWKVGWVSAAAPLVAAVRAAKQFLTYTSPAPFQAAVAQGLALPPSTLRGLAADLASKRDLLCDGLEELGYDVYRPAATYFATTDIAPVAPGLDAEAFCLALPGRCGVVAIPSSVFYDPGDPAAGRTLVRWAFCKRAPVLRDALARLASWGP
ncbi:MAG TPA: pyridoxal phosphate-dependent aminotransferase [Acidimicrobiales bacterium]|nr:pyridoxal phosphate-dependent aminotransferase [Acidimicrobiales bacterium]